MENFKITLYRAIGFVYIPKCLKDRKGEVILHISDTPYSFFYPLKKVIKKLKPDYIIHTGDLVDNIKLEFCHYSLYTYTKRLRILVDILENSKAKKIYVCVGNHDEKETIKKLSKRIHIVEKSKNIKIKNLNLRISHYSDEIIKNPLEYNLFGHDLSIKNKIDKERVYLNGIESINIIDVDNGEVTNLPYPFGLDDERLGKGKVGL
ncbi:metallophosphoesterase [Tepidibacter formicigenes]|jgi:predicted MPP superfamily phosphohydrolase|uniref:Calcineurin-like phosphoesterase n=1 Tax=Tepidibacter formicigenes DSM 15518 TaxID=1123349 RepID=A0A1M6TK32_9FIRM|nr:metallophosphoesterase [Tepidibacter formicigenes]SHK57266.1 Calcineurin-like phosphoesterase [Tepidibacter formicigenes DSM 15518]